MSSPEIPIEQRRDLDIIQRLSAYLRSKNQAYQKELQSIEALLAKAEETSKIVLNAF